MSLNATPSAERLHIGFFGIRNAGKSSVVNAITNQDLSIVSNTKGTTTDPVKKAMELLPLGPVVIIDTPGIDDEGDLGAQRVAKAKKTLRQCDCAVLVVDATCGLQAADLDLIEAFKLREIPYVIAYNKIDTLLNKGNSQVPLPAQASECLAKETCDYFSKSIPGHASPTLAANEALISAQTVQGIY